MIQQLQVVVSTNVAETSAGCPGIWTFSKVPHLFCQGHFAQRVRCPCWNHAMRFLMAGYDAVDQAMLRRYVVDCGREKRRRPAAQVGKEEKSSWPGMVLQLDPRP